MENKEDEHHDAAHELKKVMANSLLVNRSKSYLFTLLAIIIALGEYSEAVSLISDGFDSIRSEFTHDIEYEKLSNIRVGNTISYAEGILGLPQVSRSIDDQITANYFFDPKFLMTLFYKENRIEAYTITCLVKDFFPGIFRNAKKTWTLGNNTYASFPTTPQTYLIDHSKTNSYYIEKLDKGRTGLFVSSYLGNLPFGANINHELIASLYQQEVYGDDVIVLKAQSELRDNQFPNFYGEGLLDLSYIEKSLLTGAEFQSYFGS